MYVYFKTICSKKSFQVIIFQSGKCIDTKETLLRQILDKYFTFKNPQICLKTDVKYINLCFQHNNMFAWQQKNNLVAVFVTLALKIRPNSFG